MNGQIGFLKVPVSPSRLSPSLISLLPRMLSHLVSLSPTFSLARLPPLHSPCTTGRSRCTRLPPLLTPPLSSMQPPPDHPRVPFSPSLTTSQIRSSSRSLAFSRESLCCLPSASRFNVFSCVSLPRAYSSSRILPGSFCAPLSPFFREGDANVFPCSARCNTCRRSCTPRVRRALKLCAQLRAPRSHKRIGDAHGAPGKCIARLRRESGLQDYRMRQPAARPHSAALLSRFLPFFLSLSLSLSLSRVARLAARVT